MSEEQVAIRTRDGECPRYVTTPDGGGPWPAVIFYMDGLAIRPTLVGMAKRLAEAGYVVLLPDLFYRFGFYVPLDPKKVFAGDVRDAIGPMHLSLDLSLDQTRTQHDQSIASMPCAFSPSRWFFISLSRSGG